jgi:hypothetical protein
MTKRGFEFMQRWISKNFGPESNLDSGDAPLTVALLRLRSDAENEGIAWHEMAEDSDDIKDAILSAMNR